MGLIVLRGLRGVLKPKLILELVVPLGGILATLLLKAVGQPGQLEALAESRPYLAPSLDVVESFRPIAPFFLSPERAPLTVLSALGLVVVIALTVKGRGAASTDSGQRELKAPLLVYTVLGVTVLEMVFLIGPTWRDSRYLFMVEPLLFLSSSWMALFAASWVGRRLENARFARSWSWVWLVGVLGGPLLLMYLAR